MKVLSTHLISAIQIIAVLASTSVGSVAQIRSSSAATSRIHKGTGSLAFEAAKSVSGFSKLPASWRHSILPLTSGTITVNTTTDEPAVDPTLSDTAADGRISVRSAIQYTNAQPGQDTVLIPNGTYYITVPGRDEDTSATGDLDINDSLVIEGTSEGGTELYGGVDRVLDIGPINSNLAVTISKLTITQGRTRSGESGGGILVNGGTVTLDTVDVVFNASTVDGAGIEISGGTFTMNGGSLSFNTAALDGTGQGGGAYIQAGTSAFSHVAVNKNVAVNGGGIQSQGAGPNVTLSYCTFSQDSTVASAGGLGGAVSISAGSLLVDHSTFKSCYGDGGGGAFDIEEGSDTISSSRFESNYSPNMAGAIYNGSLLTMVNDTIVNNSSAGDAGGIWSGEQLNMTGGLISRNSCDGNGAGLRLGNTADTISAIVITDNIAGTSGGGVFDSNCPALYLSNVTIDSNNAGTNGGGVEDDNGGIYWIGGSLSHNTASTSGGGLYFNASSSNDTLDNISMLANSPQNIFDNTGGGFRVVQIDVSLPVQMTNFLATSSAEAVTLTWQTASEVKNAGFLVEKQPSGVSSWQLVGSYVSNRNLEGLGTSSTGRSYSFSDNKVVSGKTYNYKIQSVSTDGTTKDLSTITVTVDLPKNFALYQNYPNPFNPTTTILFELKQQSDVTLEIYNSLGQRVEYWSYGVMEAGKYNEVVDLSKYASGLYLYRIAAVSLNGERFSSIRKMVLMK